MSTIKIENVSVRCGPQPILNDISLRINPGDKVALIGPNGAGKTTLLRAILGLLPLSAGHIMLDGKACNEFAPTERAAHLAFLPQQALADEPITALEYVAAARFRFRETRVATRDAALHALQQVDVQDFASRPITQLSGGEQQRVALAALLAQEAKVILADEPANHLDPAQQVVVWTLLGQVATSGTLLVVTHDINWVTWLGPLHRTRVVALKHGQVAFDTWAHDETLPQRLSQLYGTAMMSCNESQQRVIVPTGSAGEPT